MNGHFEKPSQTAQQCEYCGLWFDRRGVNAHQMNCRFEGRDIRILPPEDSGGDPPESAPTPESPESADGVHGGDANSPPTPNADIEKPTRTDGGPGLGLDGPPEAPEPSSPTSPADLPDHYVDVETYLEAVQEEAPNVDVGALREQLAEYDVVDVEETTAESIAAYRLDEVQA